MDINPFRLKEQNKELASRIVVGLERISEAFGALLWRQAKRVGLSPIQIQLLIFIQCHEEEYCNVSYLAAEFNVTKPTISDAIKVLNRKELIEKFPSILDKRAYFIGLTKKGEEMVRQTGFFTKPLQRITGKLSEEEQLQFFDLIAKMIKGLHEEEILSNQGSCFACIYHLKDGNGSYCKLLEKPLQQAEVRLDCPEFEQNR